MKLKTFRIIISGLILIAFLSGFLFSGKFFETITAFIASWQFFPSILIASYSLIIVPIVIIALLTLLFGRIYCSSICPLGTIQDCFDIGFRKKKRKYAKTAYLIRFAVPFAAIVVFLLGFPFILTLIEPYSFAARIADNLIRPIGFRIYDISIIGTSVSAVSLLAIMLLSFFCGRYYCNSICPVGAILSFFSRFSLYAVRIDSSKCASCRKCEQICKAQCIDGTEKKIDSSRCISCFNCISLCKFNAIHYMRKKKIDSPLEKRLKKHSENGLTRRSFLGFTAIGFLSYPFTRFIPGAGLGKTPVIPPGATGLRHFTQTCTACHLCVAQCPTKVLRPTMLEYGIAGILQPMLDYKVAACDYYCNVCSGICPTGAITRLSLSDKQRTCIGTAKINEKTCIVFKDGTACAACQEMCPTGAIYMIDYKNGLPAPKLNINSCIGCGACEKACPVKPIKAIEVTAKEIHTMIHELPQTYRSDCSKKDQDFAF